MTAPTTSWRVTDSSSRAKYSNGDGIWAEDQDSDITFNSKKGTLRRVLGCHLIWPLKRASLFISGYSNQRVAWKQAEQRVKKRRKNVTIHQIDVYASNRRIEYRNVRYLAKTLGMDIPERALHHSKYEYVFLGHIPDSAVSVLYKF
ncbi:hypothetical protein COCVIDRAFT_41986 [Bipolaris victoriae FI3]|uniref:DUF7587 domain-containing protein n=1 Tax=Bipolaris victoriae (strain FI3) TaxID=930091 RepID=W7E192_BIPV3|nr:hypothetical protein COCVIDRAFT_41986 [Bipolaris victoriae FI3]